MGPGKPTFVVSLSKEQYPQIITECQMITLIGRKRNRQGVVESKKILVEMNAHSCFFYRA